VRTLLTQTKKVNRNF